MENANQEELELGPLLDEEAQSPNCHRFQDKKVAGDQTSVNITKNSKCCPYDLMYSLKMIFIPCAFYKSEDVTRSDYCNCCCQREVKNIPILLEVGGTWISSENISSWWIVSRFICMLYLVWTVVVDFTLSAAEDGYIYFNIYWLTTWANLFAMVSLMVKFVSTVLAYRLIKSGNETDLSNYGKYKRLFNFHKVLLYTALPTLTVVSVQYWTLVFDWNDPKLNGFDGYDSVNLHGGSLIVYLFDFILSNERFYYKSSLWSCLLGIAYLIWSIIFDIAGLKTAKGKPYLYEVLYWSKDPFTATAAFVFVFLSVIGFASMYTLIKSYILTKAQKK